MEVTGKLIMTASAEELCFLRGQCEEYSEPGVCGTLIANTPTTIRIHISQSKPPLLVQLGF